MKGLYKRGDIFWLRHYSGGREVRQSLETDDESAAVSLAMLILGNPVAVAAGSFEAELCRYFRWMQDRGKMRAGTVKVRGNVLRAFAARYGVEAIADLTPAIVRDWLAKIPNRQTAAGYLTSLSSLCDWLKSSGKIQRNPCDSVNRVTPRLVSKDRYVDAAAIRLLLGACQDRELKMILFLGFDCGLRKDEIIHAAPHWLNMAAGTLQVLASASWEPKDREQRVIPLTARFMAFLNEQPVPSPFLIAPAVVQGKNTYRFDPKKRLRNFMAAQGMPWVGFKVMRQSFGSVRVAGGAEIAKVSRWMGHSKMDTTMRHYIAIAPRDTAIERGI